MIEQIVEWTQLPNIHPALVHFPVAFVILAAVLEVWGLFDAGREWLDRTAVTVWAAAGLGAGAAYWAGIRAADSMTIPFEVQSHVNAHSDWGLYTLWLVGVAAAVRLGLALWRTDPPGRAVRGLFAVLSLVAVGFVLYTADLGGGLVYRHGLGVAAGEERHDGAGDEDRDAASRGGERTAAPAAVDAEAGSAADRLVERSDGAVVWTPRPSDGGAIGEVLGAAEGSSLDAVSVDERTGGEGLALAVDGRAFLVLPGTFGDVQVEAELDLTAFDGTVGLAHHVRSAGDAGLFTVEAPAGEFALLTVEERERRTLDRGSAELPRGSARLAVSAVGRHLRGTLGDELVVHGHEPALPEGAAGLLVDGGGTIRVVSMTVTPGSH